VKFLTVPIFSFSAFRKQQFYLVAFNALLEKYGIAIFNTALKGQFKDHRTDRDIRAELDQRKKRVIAFFATDFRSPCRSQPVTRVYSANEPLAPLAVGGVLVKTTGFPHDLCNLFPKREQNNNLANGYATYKWNLM